MIVNGQGSAVAWRRVRASAMNAMSVWTTVMVFGVVVAPGVEARARGGGLPQAAAQAADRTVDVRIPAQPLDSALTALADQANVRILFASADLTGRRSGGLTGRFTLTEALTRMLEGSGFTFRITENDTVTLERVHQTSGSTAVQIGPVRVTERATEGTGSYTTELTDTATRLTLPIQGTPQTVTVITHQRIEDQGLAEIQDALGETNGLFFLQSGPLGSDNNFVYSRGFPLLNYQVDGTPRSTRFGFRNDIADLVIFDRVEVIRGASGLLNAVGEPSGTVNLVRKRPTSDLKG